MGPCKHWQHITLDNYLGEEYFYISKSKNVLKPKTNDYRYGSKKWLMTNLGLNQWPIRFTDKLFFLIKNNFFKFFNMASLGTWNSQKHFKWSPESYQMSTCKLYIGLNSILIQIVKYL